MDSYDLIDSVLRIGDSDSSNELFVSRFDEFYKRQFGLKGLSFNGATFIYMLYSAILSLPLTEKFTKHGIDGVLVAKRGNKLKMVISFATPDDRLSLKFLCFDGSLRETTPVMEKSIILESRELLSISVKKRLIHSGQLETALTQIHEVSFDYGMINGLITVKPRISTVPNNIEVVRNSNARFSELLLVQKSEQAAKMSILAKHLQSDSFDVFKYNSHEFTKLLITMHQIGAQTSLLSMTLKDMYLSLLGSIEMNWANSLQLKIMPVFDKSSTNVIHGLMITHKSTNNREWASESTPLLIQLLDAASSTSKNSYTQAMFNKMVKVSPCGQVKKFLAIGIEYNKLLHSLNEPMNPDSFPMSPFTLLLTLNPMENLLDMLLKQPNSETLLPRLNYCIRNLNAMGGQFGLQSYLYGQLASRNDMEKFVFHSGTSQKSKTSFAFKLKNTEVGVQFDIYQTTFTPRVLDDIKIVPFSTLSIHKMLLVTVRQTYNNVLNEKHVKVHLIKSFAQFLTQADLQRRARIPDTHWWPVFDVDSTAVLKDIEARAEHFEELPDSDRFHVLLDSIDRNLLRFENKMSVQDIVNFMSGLFVNWQKIFYHGFLGIIKNDGSPIFLSSLETELGDQENLVQEKLRSINTIYVREDFKENALRRTATFVCITSRPSETDNTFGIARLTTFGIHKYIFDSCLNLNNVRTKRNVPCSDDESPKFENNEMEPRQRGAAVQIKLQPYLETMNKVSKLIMTAQIFKDMIGALIRGDYKTFAVNTAFLVGGPLLECLSMKMMVKGASLGGNFLGRSLIVSAPFLSRVPFTGFIAFDLYEQIESYKNGNKGAMVNIASDSTILTIDFATASIEGAEALGVMSGVADVAGPIGFAIGTAIFVGVDIYSSVETVSNIDEMVRLTGWQKFTTGLLSFLHISPPKIVQKEIFEKTTADASIENAANFFKSHPSVRYYIFPSYQQNGKFSEDNIINLRLNVTRLAHSWPKDVVNTKLVCAGSSTLPVKKTSKLLFNCSSAFGYESTSKEDNVVILMEHGNDTVKTFRNKSTTFLIGNGNKYVVGSMKNDIFVFYGNNTSGYVNGMSGRDLLNLENFNSHDEVRVNFLKSQLTSSGQTVKLFNIQGLIGREFSQEIIVSSCYVTFLDTRGGSELSPDIVTFKENCFYDTTIRINGFMNLRNEAMRGNFTNLLTKNFNARIFFAPQTNINQMFVFEHVLEDLTDLQILKSDNTQFGHNITFKIDANNFLDLANVHSSALFIFSDRSELRVNNGTASLTVLSNDTSESIYKKYALLSERLNTMITVYSSENNISMLFAGGIENSSYVSILPNDPDHETYLIAGKNQNVFRISMQNLHNSTHCKTQPIPSVTITDYAKSNFVNVIDLYEIILIIHEKFAGQVVVRIERRGSNLLMRVYAQCPLEAMTNIVNVTMSKALENENYKNLVVNMRRPMTITVSENATFLVPADYNLLNRTYTVIHSDLVEPFTTLISQKTVGSYDITVYNGSNLILTNLRHVNKENDTIILILKDFFYFHELQTLRLIFSDQSIDFPKVMDEYIGEFPNFDDIFNDETLHEYSIV